MAQFPVVYAGTKVTTTLLQSMIPFTVRKTGNEVLTSTATAQNDDHLFHAVVANASYQLEMALFVNSPDAADFEMAFTVPSGATLRWGSHGVVITATTYGGDVLAPMRDETQTSNMSASGGGVTVLVAGTLNVGATAGNVQLTWMQDVSNAGATTVYAGSWMRLTRQA